jgi:hypothetical protein
MGGKSRKLLKQIKKAADASHQRNDKKVALKNKI